MPSKASSKVLIDHDEIRSWAETRGAKPAAVRNTSGEEDVGIIRLDFPGYSGGDSLEEIEWDEWFEKFDDNNLALVVQDKMANGQKSNFNKLVNRENVDVSADEESEGRSSRRTTTSRSSSGRSASARGAKTKAASARASSGGRKASSSERSGRESKRTATARASHKTTRRKKAA